MRKTIVTAVAAFVLGAVSAGVLAVHAQPAGPPPGRPGLDGPGRVADGPMPGRWGHWGHGPRMPWAHRSELMRTFALVHPADDRKLAPADVQKIAEAFLLWNGNHSWRVLNVAAVGDGIAFDLATKEGSVIARFSMDPKTGHLTRVN